ncbi:ribosylnicotinamide kinase [Aspergillus glaucus CBS 516.65]|uniref:Phosphoribulokinase/uridine kinase domain-containing protein n=1 Tax=Aspergillus glaucus CBS 516.65 TaxID=1160497 RepID=A0A1L9VZ10_ASPGL|nr:hypothetical protein ASPGLDRAFT_115720 [Aspergillus glaucus CBS 516.65]OJJ89156.1 hypothetical protein ASPGLDRAFT_115720 [Aspergillus glaucus CBS 516.65]
MTSQALVIGISGPSSSGKTTLARLLQRVFSPALSKTFIIHEDDFYVPDNQIPYTTTPSGKTLQDWDCVEALDITRLSRALSYIHSTGSLPDKLKSIQDLNEDADSGVSLETVERLRRFVEGRLASSTPSTVGKGSDDRRERTLAFLEGILLYAPKADKGHVLRPVNDNIDVRLFLPTAYEDVKVRREARSGYVTSGPAQELPLPQRNSASDGSGEGEEGQQTFWEDPPGYVDNIVWPHYVRDHAWLLVPEGEQDVNSAELVRKAGSGTNVRTDVGIAVAPGQGSRPMTEILTWAVEEVLKCWERVQ